MLFPQLGPQYYNEKDKPMLSRMEAFYAESITINQSFWAEADTDTRFWTGDQTLWNDLYGNLPANRRRQFNFNRIRRVINMISGHQRRNRKSIIVNPRENADNKTADQLTKIFMSTCDRESILNTISESFEGALVTGMNFLHIWLDYRNDPISGNIRVDNCSYNSFLVDPYFRKPDLSDCKSIWKRSFLTKREIISLLPDYTEEILGLAGNDSGLGRDGKFQFMPESYNYGFKNLLTYDEFYYRDFRHQRLLIDAQTGESFEWRGNDENLRLFLQRYPTVSVEEHEVPTVKLAIVVQGKVFYDGVQPMGIDKYPFVPTLAYYAPQMPYFPQRVQGVVRDLRDSQFLYNRRKAIELDILESQVNSGWIYKENALVNPLDVFTVAGQGVGIALKQEASMTDVQQIQSPIIPPSTIELSKILGQEISEISGVSEELLGASSDQVAGVLSMLRQGAGLTTLQKLFDQLDQSQKYLGELMLDIIQANYTPGKIKQILEGEEPTEQFYNRNFGKYHIVISEGLNTDTQKQMNFAQLIQLKEIGVPIPDTELLQAATIQNKDKLIQSIQQQQQQAQQMQMQQAQLQAQDIQSRIELTKARAVADQGLGLERISRVEENKALAVERRAKAVHEQDEGILAIAKALHELDSISIDQIEKLVAISNMIDRQKQKMKAENNPQPQQESPAGQIEGNLATQ
jgi:hypothetical protein